MLDKVDPDRLVVASLVRRGPRVLRASVLRAIGTLSVVGGFGVVGIRCLVEVEASVRELVLAIVMFAHDVKTSASSTSINLL